MQKVPVVILGSGNIGMDLMYKVIKSPLLEVGLVAGIDPKSRGLALAKSLGFNTTVEGIEGLRKDPSLGDIVLDATSAAAHAKHAEVCRELGKKLLDLTPAALGSPVVPVVNIDEHLDDPDLCLITCGGQATIPIVYAISRVSPVEYAEIVATISSRSAGPGTRQNIDEFTQATGQGLVTVGTARKGKAIIILNPADPPIMMHNTIYTIVEKADKPAITEAVEKMVSRIQKYVPGYSLKVKPQFDGNKVTTMIGVTGAGDYLPKYSGNLDVMTSAAVAMAERLVETGKVRVQRKEA
jgi:acetaldehyde dehydrogenase